MRLEFYDYREQYGYAEDDGSTYTWGYEGADAEIEGLLEEAIEWTGVDSVLDPEATDPLDRAVPAERFDAPLSPEERLEKLARILEWSGCHITLLE